MSSSFNVGQELYISMNFISKDAIKNALKQYVMKVYQSFKVLETKSHKYLMVNKYFGDIDMNFIFLSIRCMNEYLLLH